MLAAGRGAQVSGLDASEALIEIARDRVPSGDFRVGDLEELPFSDSQFDVIFASLSIMFASDPSAALRDMGRVAVPGGKVTVGIWGKPEDCEYRYVLQAVADMLPAPAPNKGPFALSGAGILEGMMETVGLTIHDTGEADAPFLFANIEMMWRMVSSAGPIQSAMQSIGEQKLKAAIIRAAEPFQIEDGKILFNNRFRYVTANV